MTAEEQIAENRKWMETEEGQQRIRQMTGEDLTEEDHQFIAEQFVRSSIVQGRKQCGHLTLQGIAKALKDSLPAEELAEVCRILLIYQN